MKNHFTFLLFNFVLISNEGRKSFGYAKGGSAKSVGVAGSFSHAEGGGYNKFPSFKRAWRESRDFFTVLRGDAKTLALQFSHFVGHPPCDS